MPGIRILPTGNLEYSTSTNWIKEFFHPKEYQKWDGQLTLQIRFQFLV
jgi:hypothetical protein